MSSARQNELSDLQSYIKHIDKEITLILQSLQWNRGTLISEKPPVTCALNMAHKVPLENKAKHEAQCWLKSLGYYAEDKLLPEPLDPNANTIVKLGPNDIKLIIDTASNNDPSFKKGNGWNEPVPLTLERVQTTYTMDERRAIHDAVVASVPACHDLSDLALFDVNAVKSESEDVKRSRTEILAELRDMKRRRTKYRVAAKSRNYSDVLRDVIKAQMEMLTDTDNQTECGHTSDANISSESTRRDDDYSNIQMHIKRERSTSRQRDYSESRNGNERNDNSDQRYDSRDSRSSNRHHKRKRSRSKDIYEYRDKRHTSSNDRGREKRDRKEKDDYRKERSSRRDYDDRTNKESTSRRDHDDRTSKESTSRRDDDDRTHRDKHEERRENRRYNESHRDEHTKRSYHSDNKYEGRRKDKHSRNYDERVRDERHESDKYNRDNQRTDNYYTKERRHDRSKHSKRDSNSREYSEDNRYWNNHAVKIKQEVDESPHDSEHRKSENGVEDRSPQKVTIKQEKDDYE